MYGDGEGFRGERSLVGSHWSAVVGRQSLVGSRWSSAIRRPAKPAMLRLLVERRASLRQAQGWLSPVTHPQLQPMPYRVISFTMAQVRQGALGFQRELSAVLREHPEIKVYSVSPFDLDERRRFKDRFGGDIVYFLNDAACQRCEQLGLSLEFLTEISDDELPRRRTLVVGTPERGVVRR